jgi:hypothetical protein
VKYINSVVITDSERDVEVERMSMYILNEVETSRHLISIRLYFILTILITEDGSQPYFFLTIATQLVFFITYNKIKKYLDELKQLTKGKLYITYENMM